MSARLLEVSFLAIVVVLLGLVVGLNCLQGTTSAKFLGILECNYGLTSNDFRIKAAAAAVLVIFLGLIFGPVMAAMGRPRGKGRSKRST